MDWSLELRSYRARNGLKQEALADLLQISQAYVSRLESGKAEPKDALEHKIRSLVSNPAQLDVLDFVLKSTRISPHICAVVKAEASGLNWVAFSQGFKDQPLFELSNEGQPIKLEMLTDGEQVLGALDRSGIFDGSTTRIDILWNAEWKGQRYFWDSVCTPVRAGSGVWYLYVSMTPLTSNEHTARLEERGSIMHVERTRHHYTNPSFTAAC